MSHSDLGSHNSYSDDPVELGLEKTKKKFSSLLVLILFAVAGTFFIQNTLAANISLNSGGPVEFGQGITQTVACSGATNLTITPSSTFTNASGAGSYKFNSITVSNIPEGCHGSDFTINAYDNTSNTPLALFNTTSTSAIIYNNAGNFELGINSTGMTVAGSSGTFTITFTVPVALASSIFKITIQSGAHAVATCAQGGPCIVGDRGPGGGIVYYVSASNFTSAGSNCNTTCKYLEVAPSTWQSGTVADDLFYIWSTDTTTLTVQNKSTASSEGFNSDEKLNWKIGQGFYNTSVMKVAGATSSAQAAVLAYAGNSTAGQWFIPSMNELNELCKYVRGQSTGNPKVACVIGSGTFKSTANAGTDLGGFVVTDYWSSSESPANSVWAQSFGGNYQGLSSKDNTYSTRPVRAF
jgi:hypothetical protein